VNLDPAAEIFEYTPSVDIRELINISDVMEDEEMHFGPNGGLVFCMEFLMENTSWLEEELGQDEDDYFLFDCPGQIELFTHLDVMRKFVEFLHSFNFRVCAVFLLDSHFMINSTSFISGAMAALSAMVTLEVPWVNVLTKIDLLSRPGKKQLERFLEPDARDLCADESYQVDSVWREKHRRLTAAIGEILEDYSLVKFSPLNIKDEESINDLMMIIDNCLQFAEDQDVKCRDFDDAEDDNQGDEQAFNEMIRDCSNQG